MTGSNVRDRLAAAIVMDIDGLVERLRQCGNGVGFLTVDHHRKACREAAAELTRLKSEVEALRAENERVTEALTPSGDTKYAYMGEFSWTDWRTDAKGVEQGYEMVVPWTTIKEIMAAIRARSALTGAG